MTNSRAIAATIIHRVCYNHLSLSEVLLETTLPNGEIPFIKEMCFGVIRFWIQLQVILKTVLEKPLKQEDKDIECLLCVGLYQILFMRIAKHALVDETVTATRALKKAWASGLVNKILRIVITQQKENTLKIKGITAEFSHPNWIIDAIKNAWPENWKNILEANNQKAPLFLRVNKTKINSKQFQKKLSAENIASELIEDLPQAILITKAIPIEKIPGFYDGLFSVQDASGQKVIDYLDLQSDHIILDACAAPGSKTTHILECYPIIKKLISVDSSQSRLAKINENIKRLQLNSQNVKLMVVDILSIQQEFSENVFDRILLDAPCSAIGVIRRHPDIKILRKKTDIKNLSEQQLIMLKTIWPLLKPNGKLIYTTCSILPNENEQVIQLFLAAQPNAKIIPINNNWGINLQYGQQVLTGDHNRDGFFYSILQKSCG